MTKFLFTIVFTLIIAGCGSDPSSAHNGKGDPIVDFEDDDAEMNAAMKHARSTVDTFIADLDKSGAERIHIVKLVIDNGGENEHIWAYVSSYDAPSETFHGILANKPNSPSYNEGDQVNVKKAILVIGPSCLKMVQVMAVSL